MSGLRKVPRGGLRKKKNRLEKRREKTPDDNFDIGRVFICHMQGENNLNIDCIPIYVFVGLFFALFMGIPTPPGHDRYPAPEVRGMRPPCSLPYWMHVDSPDICEFTGCL